MSSKETKKKGSKAPGIVLIIIGSIFTAAFWAFFLYTPVQQGQGNFAILSKDYADNVTIIVNDDVDIADVNVVLLDPSSEYIFKADWTYIYFEMGNMEENQKIDIKNSTQNESITIDLKLLQNDQYHSDIMGFVYFELTIQLNPKYIYNFTHRASTGNFHFVGENVTFGKFDVMQSTGNVDIALKNLNISDIFTVACSTGDENISIQNAQINGTFSTDASTGDAIISLKNVTLQEKIYDHRDTGKLEWTFENLTFQRNATINHDSSTGDFKLGWKQSYSPANKTDVIAKLSTGNMDITIEIPLTVIRYSVYAQATTGSITVNGKDQGDSTNTQSSNYSNNSLVLMSLSLETSTGNMAIVHSTT